MIKWCHHVHARCRTLDKTANLIHWISVNIARLKPAQQSSTLGTASASRAVDGWGLTNIIYESCARSLRETDPYWMVDLEVPFLVGTVSMRNAGSCCRMCLLCCVWYIYLSIYLYHIALLWIPINFGCYWMSYVISFRILRIIYSIKTHIISGQRV